MKSTRVIVVLVAVALTAAAQARTPQSVREQQRAGREDSLDGATDIPFFSGITDPASLTHAVEVRLDRARHTLDGLLAVTGKRTVHNTLRPYDNVRLDLGGANGLASLVRQLHPDAEMRKTAESLAQRSAAFSTDVSLNRGLYDALTNLDVTRADAATRHYVERDLRDYRRQGVEKDEPTRQRIKELREELVRITQEFDRNVRDGVRSVRLTSVADLDGLPADYVAAHKTDASGIITLTTEAPDSQPVMLYARNEDVRRRMLMESQNVGYPANMAVIDRMIATRAALALILNASDWATYDIGDRMARNAKAAAAFIDRIVAVSAPKLERERAMLLERKRQDHPGADTINAWERRYYTELVRQASYAFDSQAVRPYLTYDRVRDGVLTVTTRLFGFEFRPARQLPVWHSSVEPYEVFENGQLVGRVYLDMHPRADKGGSGASAATVRSGVSGRQIPEVVLIARVSGGRPGDPGLMTHDQVIAFFHEFGHVIHALASGRLQWIGLTRVAERDFIEAPSQMLEEWAWDPATLATFATHYQTNERIPEALVRQMQRASELGRAFDVRQQMVFAKLSLSLHDRDPKQVDVTTINRALVNEYLPMPYVEGTHFPAGFTHLANPNYSAAYYTYMWSLVISKDLYKQFDARSLLAPAVARRYRQTVLAPGGSQPAAVLVEQFLGRPFGFGAWEEWLNREVDAAR